MAFNPTGHFPDGHFPEGHFPEAQSGSPYPTVPRSRSIRLPAGGVWVVDPDVTSFCEVDFSDVLPDGVTLSSVARTIPSGLTEQDAATDTVNGRFAIKLTGMQHASMHQIALVATLSNAQSIAVTAALRCFNG